MTLRVGLLPAALATLLLVAPARGDDAPAAQDVERARQHFQRGVTFYQAADYRSALVEFQDAYRAAPNYRVLFNVGQTCKELADYACAVRSFRDYLARGGGEIEKPRRAEVEAELQRLERHVAAVEITVNEAGAKVSAEGERRVELGHSPLAEPVLLNGGRWMIRARKSGFVDAEEQIEVSGGNRRAVRLTLAPQPSDAPLAATSTPRPIVTPVAAAEAPPPRSQTPVWIGAGVTAALAIGATVTGVMALGAKSDYDEAVGRFGSTADDVSSARSKTRTLALATDVLAAAALAGAVVTIVLVITAPPPPKVGAHRFIDALSGRVTF